MTQNTSGLSEGSVANTSACDVNLSSYHESMDKMYTYFYLLLFIPGLLLNTTALWVLCRHISKKTKAVIFMINLALADLAHILSLPLRIYYYFTHTWPFGRTMCLFCFYLKYLNMYAAIVFLVCISVQRCVFLLDPFSARRWRRRYDLLISFIVWVVVGLACSPFILMRSSNSNETVSNISHHQVTTSTQLPTFTSSCNTSESKGNSDISLPSNALLCFKDLPMRHLPLPLAITMMVFAELFGFLIPFVCICYSSIRIADSLKGRHNMDQQNLTSLNSSARSRLQSVTSNCPSEKYQEKQTTSEKRRALQMVLACCALFLFCFAPYHVNFLLYLMVSQEIVYHCPTVQAVKQFHPVSLCIASLSCFLNPLLYYFLTAEFRAHLKRRTSSFSSSLLSSPVTSPVTSPTSCPTEQRLMRLESSCSERESLRTAWILKPTRHQTTSSVPNTKLSHKFAKLFVLTVDTDVPWLKMNYSCEHEDQIKEYQHRMYAIVYSVILAPGLLCNVLAIWVFRIYIRETKKAVVFMMNLAVADLLQVLSLPLRIYYYLNDTWPFGHFFCMICFYLKYVNMYASIYFLVCVTVRRCELIVRPLTCNSPRRKGDLFICGIGWFLVCLCCLPFPLLRNPTEPEPEPERRSNCFSELPMTALSPPAAWALLILAELFGFIIPLVLVMASACMTAGSLREATRGAIADRGEKRRALRMVLSCAAVFLLCFVPYHITMPLDFMVKANVLKNCDFRKIILQCHPVTLCLASLNCSLDPLMYYFTTDEFWRRLSKPEIPDSMAFSRRLSCMSGGADLEDE
ncbi:uncharacterized protein LOC125008586 [Mugil cephalus]|uniref:uncharacterized protein LOC125008586 n=1 Tax=Mugil cephalus TaxID=48193 RepID=UPI001FB67927|nr:uncharacterized protein LOC125008586 [Mugil cephalus]